MSLLDQLQPRDHKAAARVVSVLCAIGVTVTLVLLPIAPDNDPTPNPVARRRRGRLVPRGGRPQRRGLVLQRGLPVGVGAEPVPGDRGASSRPTWRPATRRWRRRSSSCSRPCTPPRCCPGTARRWSPAAAVLGQMVVVFTLLPTREAIFDAGYMGAALVATAAMLVRGAERQVTLMAELEHLAGTDSLTGLVTRRAFDEAAVVGARCRPRRRRHRADPARRRLVQVGQRPLRPPRWRRGADPAGRPAGARVAGVATWCAGSAATSWPCCCPAARSRSATGAPRR